MVRVFGQKLGIFITKIENFSKTKLQNTIKLVIIRSNSNLLDTLTLYLPEFILKFTETSKKIEFCDKKLNYEESIKITASYLKFTAIL